MNLDLTEEQLLLRDEALRLLGDLAGSAQMRHAADERNGFDPDLWNTVATELGWCGLAIPQEDGGLGMGAMETTLLLEACGRHLACIPLWSTICLAAPLIEALGKDSVRSDLLGRIAAGQLQITVAYPAFSKRNPMKPPAVTAIQATGGYTFSGDTQHVPDLAAADMVIVPAGLPDGTIGLFALLAGKDYRVETLETIDPTRPMASLRLEDVTVSEATRIDQGGLQATDFAHPVLRARIGLAAEQVGAAQGCFDLTLSYIGERVQFGRTIASFQAIKHRCAMLAVGISEARSLLRGAAALLDAGKADASAEIDALGFLASRALFNVAEESIQMHGGVGMTWEYDPHYFFRRAQASGTIFGSQDERLDAVADFIFEGTSS